MKNAPASLGIVNPSVICILLSKYNSAAEPTNLTDRLKTKEVKSEPGMKERKGC